MHFCAEQKRSAIQNKIIGCKNQKGLETSYFNRYALEK